MLKDFQKSYLGNMIYTDFTSLRVNPNEEILVVIIPIRWNVSA